MHQENVTPATGRDPMREYQKQKKKLALIEFECILNWIKRSILLNKTKVARLTDEISEIHQYLQSLENEKTTILKDLSQQNAWTKPGNQRQTLKLMEINAK
jgi:hypothetical protein